MSDLTTSTTGANYSAGSDAPTPAPAAPVKTTARWEDFIDIFYNPSAVFARRANSGFGIPMLVVALLVGGIMLVTFNAMQPVMDAEFSRVIAKASQAPNWKPEMAQTMRTMGSVTAKIGGFIGMPIAIFITGLVLWMVGKFFDAKESLNSALMVTSYAFVPRVLAAVLTVVQALLLNPDGLNGMNRLSIGPARFLDPDVASPVMVALASRFDLITIWCTVLLAIGLSVTGKIPRARAAIAAAIVWALAALPALGQAMRS